MICFARTKTSIALKQDRAPENGCMVVSQDARIPAESTDNRSVGATWELEKLKEPALACFGPLPLYATSGECLNAAVCR